MFIALLTPLYHGLTILVSSWSWLPRTDMNRYDFNEDLISHSYSNERNVLQDIIQLNSFTPITDEYTRVTANSMSLIDHICNKC